MTGALKPSSLGKVIELGVSGLARLIIAFARPSPVRRCLIVSVVVVRCGVQHWTASPRLQR